MALLRDQKQKTRSVKIQTGRSPTGLLTNCNLLKLVLPLAILVVVAWRVSGLHTLGVLGGIRESEELLLQFGGHVDAGEVGSLSSNTDLLVGLVSQENALLRRVALRVHS